MNKKIIILGALIISGVTFSQVGIDTEAPKATLDIRASPSNANKTDGLIAPRLTGNQLKGNDAKYGTDQIGAIIYATAAANPVTQKTQKVTETGYYYFDGTIWQKFAFGTGASTVSASNGTHATGSEVKLGGALTEPTTISALTNTNKLSFQAANTTDAYVTVGTGSGASGGVMLGNTSHGITRGFPELGSNNSLGIYTTRGSDPTAGIYLSANGKVVDQFVVKNNGNIGIGTDVPDAKFHINNGTTNGAIKIVDGTQGAGKVLTSNADGLATWQPLPAITPLQAENGTQVEGSKVKLGGALTKNTIISALTSTNKLSFQAANTADAYVTIGTGGGASGGVMLGNTSHGITRGFPDIGEDNNVGVYTTSGDVYLSTNGAATGEFVLRDNGNVGIGTTVPDKKLDIRTGGTAAAPVTGFKLVDGNQKTGKILTSDANGVGTWKEAETTSTIGFNGAAGTAVGFSPIGHYRSTGSYIDLPPGKWFVSVSQLVRLSGTLADGQWLYLRTTFSEQGATPGDTASPTADLAKPSLVSALIRGPYNGLGYDGNGGQAPRMEMINGSVVINNTSTSTKRYYYVAGNTVSSHQSSPSAATIEKFGGAWSENSILATRIQ